MRMTVGIDRRMTGECGGTITTQEKTNEANLTLWVDSEVGGTSIVLTPNQCRELVFMIQQSEPYKAGSWDGFKVEAEPLRTTPPPDDAHHLNGHFSALTGRGVG